MPTYTVQCKTCGDTVDVVAPMSDAASVATWRRCLRCGGEFERVFAVPRIKTDEFSEPKVMDSLPPLAEGQTRPDVVTSRSGLKKYLAAQNAKHGWKLVSS